MQLIKRKAGRFVLPFFYLMMVLLSSCKHERTTKRAFYFWKQEYNPTAFELQRMKDLQINRLYIKLFDVRYENNGVYPVAKINLEQGLPDSIETVPVIYITTEALQHTPKDSVDDLAAKILRLTENITSTNGMHYRELQIDCDWTPQTKASYFQLLVLLRSAMHQRNALLSATIRLHQVKYAGKTGIPPVDRGMLMYYNMGKLNDPKEINSVYNYDNAQAYIESVSNYKLPLDLALPAFSWAVHLHKNKVTGLENDLDEQAIKSEPRFMYMNANRYVVRESFYRKGVFFDKGDLLRLEHISGDDMMHAAEQVHQRLKNSELTVSLFHLDSLQQSHYEIPQLQEVFDLFD